MQDNGPLIALIFFIIFTGWFGYMAYDTHDRLWGEDPNGEDSKYQEVKDLRAETAEVENANQLLRDKIDVLRENIQLQEVRYQLNDRHEGIYLRAYNYRRKLVELGEKFSKQADVLGASVVEVKEKTASSIRKDENAVRTKVEEDVSVYQEKKEASLARTISYRKDLEQFEKIYRRDKNYDESVRGEFRRQLDVLTTRDVERANVTVEIDGKVVLADVLNKTVVINLGTSHGVRNGFRFEVFTMRPGSRKVVKGFVEVRNATASMSECMILQKLVALPKDPFSDYVATHPEEKYSPYHDSGKKGFSAQPLSARPKNVILGHNSDNPIVVGDYIQNAFYSPGKSYTFYIAGEKAIVNGAQKSAIHYQWPHIERVVKYYGGKVAKKVDLGIDYIIAQKNPQDDEEFNKAITLGIPVIYEWELFRFLDQR